MILGPLVPKQHHTNSGGGTLLKITLQLQTVQVLPQLTTLYHSTPLLVLALSLDAIAAYLHSL